MTEPESAPAGNLTRCLMEQCASECVAAARNTVSAVHQHQTHDINMLPAWWYRVFYTHTAAMVLAVSTLRPDLFPRSSTQTAWENALALLQAHESFSESVRVCKVALQRIFSRIEQTQIVPSSTDLLDRSLPDTQDVIGEIYPNLLQDFSYDLDDLSVFRLDDISWLTNA